MYNIAIDTSPLFDDNSKRGVGYYTKNLVSALKNEVSSNPEFKNYQITLINESSPRLNNFSLIHYPYFDPFFITLPLIKKIPRIITVHDLIPRQFKANFPVGIRGEIKWNIQRYLAKKSDYIITDSHYSKYVIAELLDYSPDHIYVTYLAANSTFHQIYDKNGLEKIKKKYQLPTKFILYVGDINWNKNIPNLVNTCLKLKYPLVIVGASAIKKSPNHDWNRDLSWLQNKIHSIKAKNLITLTGFIPDNELPLVYNLATIYCQPSYCEGFGLNVVQAMQSGTPVIYSNQGSLPEIMDYCGEQFNPYDQLSLEKSIKKLWKNHKLCQEYSQKGLIRSQFFSWKYTAIQTLSVYKLALEYGK